MKTLQLQKKSSIAASQQPLDSDDSDLNRNNKKFPFDPEEYKRVC